jgi:hypothetical protein
MNISRWRKGKSKMSRMKRFLRIFITICIIASPVIGMLYLYHIRAWERKVPDEVTGLTGVWKSEGEILTIEKIDLPETCSGTWGWLRECPDGEPVLQKPSQRSPGFGHYYTKGTFKFTPTKQFPSGNERVMIKVALNRISRQVYVDFTLRKRYHPPLERIYDERGGEKRIYVEKIRVERFYVKLEEKDGKLIGKMGPEDNLTEKLVLEKEKGEVK